MIVPDAGSSPTIEEKVAFLSRPEAYPCGSSRVDVIETHMSWVFLTDRHAWKLKKPIRYDSLDFSTLELRRADCEREVALNRRLAANVYHGTVPLTTDPDEKMSIAGDGSVVDWLVQMRRLPRERMLDRAIEQQTVTARDVVAVGRLLAEFYQREPTVELAPAEYVARLGQGIRGTREELLRPLFRLPADLVEAASDQPIGYLSNRRDSLEVRVREGWIIDAHGDLRPEHVCLEQPPVIIDCLEFSRDLRLLDAASDLSFLMLECERLGAAWIGTLLWDTYRETTGDDASRGLLSFYRSQHALTRAKIAVWHLPDAPADQVEKWRSKAVRYLELARGESAAY
ncbi:MAG: hypothetical protein WD069_18485 [Planctomycetales bacterium]